MTRSTRSWLVAIAVIVFGLGLALSAKIFLTAWKAFGLIDKSFVRILVPGVRTVALPAPGTYTIFFEHHSELNGKNYSSSEDALDGLSLSITNAETGEAIAVRAAGAKSTYSIGSREGRSIFSFAIPRAGRYRFLAALPDEEADGQRYVLAIGRGLDKNIFLVVVMIFGMVFTLVLSVLAPTVLIVFAVGPWKGEKDDVKGVDGKEPSG